ncbi:MAG TPA: SDR family oxidoreductase [Clostridiales bacterium]|nr:SDR family oxidoreductase [Clostridiales bacterium]
MKASLKGKTIVLTGGGGGIGRAAAQALAKEGARIALCGGNNIEKLEKTACLVKDCGAEVFVLPGDLTDFNFLENCIEKIASHFGQIDILINNAGIALNKPFEETTQADFDRIFSINVRAPFILCQKVLPYLRKSNHAAIINIASVVGHKGYVNQAAYAASKHALIGFTKTLANEVYTQNIRVHIISPGGVYTDMVKVVRPDLKEEGMILPEEIADIILFLLQSRGNAVIDEICVHRVGKQPFDV